METSKSGSSVNKSCDDDQSDRDDEQPTTSKRETSRGTNPEDIAYNMNDLKAIDLNSADEVRQTMKAILAGKVPPFHDKDEHCAALRENCDTEPLRIIKELNHNHPQKQSIVCTLQRIIPAALKLPYKEEIAIVGRAGASGRSKRKRGRPPKAAPSKKIKRRSVSTMYIGKLTNVVPFSHFGDTESDSDTESVASR